MLRLSAIDSVAPMSGREHLREHAEHVAAEDPARVDVRIVLSEAAHKGIALEGLLPELVFHAIYSVVGRLSAKHDAVPHRTLSAG